MRIKFILSILFIAGSLVVALAQKTDLFSASPPPPSVFSVETKDGEITEVTNPKLKPLFGTCEDLLGDCDSVQKITLDTKRGNFEIYKDLWGVERIDVLEVAKTHTLMRVTFRDGDVLEGKHDYIPNREKNPRNPRDYIRGTSGKLGVGISFDDIVSITRKEQSDE